MLEDIQLPPLNSSELGLTSEWGTRGVLLSLRQFQAAQNANDMLSPQHIVSLRQEPYS